MCRRFDPVPGHQLYASLCGVRLNGGSASLFINLLTSLSAAVRKRTTLRNRFCYDRAMNPWVAVILIVVVAIVSGVFTYLFTRMRIAKESAHQARALGEAVTALENEKEKYEQAANGIRENARREALDEFLADIRVEERHYVREHRVLFAHKKSLIVQERIFFRNIPISSWIDHEIPVEEGADIDALAKTLSVFNNAIEDGVSGSRGPRQLPFGAGSIGSRQRLG